MFTWSFGCTGFLRAQHAAQHLDRAVRDDLVRVHVGLGARAGLPDDQREMSSNLPSITSCAAAAMACPSFGSMSPWSMLTSAQAFLMTPSARTMAMGWFSQPIGKVDDRPLGLRAPVLVGGNLKRAEAVGLGAGCGHGGPPHAAVRAVIGEAGGEINWHTVAYRRDAVPRLLAELVEADNLGGVLGLVGAGFVVVLDLVLVLVSSECVSNRRPNSTEGSTKVRTASKGMTIGSGWLPKFSVIEKPSSVTTRFSNQCWMTTVISAG